MSTSIRSKSVCFTLVALLASLSALAFDEVERHPKWKEPDPLKPQVERLAVDSTELPAVAARRFLAERGGEWEFFVDQRTGRPSLVMGSGIAMLPGAGNELAPASRAALLDVNGEYDIERIEPQIRAFLDGYPSLRPGNGTLELDVSSSASRDNGRLVSVYYSWLVDGVAVENARVYARLNSGNVTQFGSQNIGTLDISTVPALDAKKAMQLLLEYSEHGELGAPLGEPKLLIQPEEAADGSTSYRLVWELRYKVADQIETWGGRVDAQTGEVVRFIDTNHYLDASGGVYPRSVFLGGETKAPFRNIDLRINGATLATDNGGIFPFTGGTTETTLQGPTFDVDCQGCSNPAQPFFQSTIGSGRVDLGFGDLDIIGNGVTTSADRNTIYHLEYARQIGIKWLPSEPYFAATGFDVNTNINSSCNATYGGFVVNFFRQAGTCNNTGNISDVVYHEYGHGIDLQTFAGDGGTGEGTADVVSMNITLGNEVGPGFRLTGGPVRDLDSTTSSLGVHTLSDANAICGSSPHCRGQVFGQSAWDLAQSFVARDGFYTGWRLSERLFFTSLPDAQSLDPSSGNPIYVAYIQADDDDGNLANGTPNATEIFNAFNTHEIATTPFAASAQCVRPEQPALTVTPGCSDFQLDWSAVGTATGYELFRTELMAERAYMPIASLGAGQTTYVDREVIPGVDYYYYVMAVDGAQCESTVENPQFARLTAQPVLSISAAIDDDTPAGNRSGFADPGENVDLILTIDNFGEIPADSLAGSVLPLTPGVSMVENSPSWPSVASNGQEVGDGVVRFNIDEAQVSCGDTLEFRYVPFEGSGCSLDTSYFTVQVGEPDGSGGFVCDSTPACFAPASFAGIDVAQSGGSCGETELSWLSAGSNCVNADITYNIYRSETPGFTPDASNLLVGGVTSTNYTDALLNPNDTYYYIVRAFDSRSGEETNTVEKAAVVSNAADTASPIFSGLNQASGGMSCGESSLSWSAGLESCSLPVTYDIYRSEDPAFIPDASNLVGSTLSTEFTDASGDSGVSYTYIVRARDGIGNAGSNEVRVQAVAAVLDDVRFQTDFETSDESWSLGTPNDAPRGIWEWGNPQASASQPEDDATENGTECWITGAPGTLPDGNNNDVDDGTTTLLSFRYDMLDTVNPIVAYSRWFSNAQGASPGEDVFQIDVSNNGGATWTPLETVSDDNTEWIDVELPLGGVITPTAAMQFRFTASDLGAGSLVDAGIDNFRLFDKGQGCNVCVDAVGTVGTIFVDVESLDAKLDWTADPIVAERFGIFKLSGPTFSDAVLVGVTSERTFLHENALSANESFYYRVAAIDSCGNRGPLE